MYLNLLGSLAKTAAGRRGGSLGKSGKHGENRVKRGKDEKWAERDRNHAEAVAGGETLSYRGC